MSTQEPSAFDAFVQSARSAAEQKTPKRSPGRASMVNAIRADLDASAPDDPTWEASVARMAKIQMVDDHPDLQAAVDNRAFAGLALFCWQHRQAWIRLHRQKRGGKQ